MDLICDERKSASPFVERIWRSHSENGGAFLSMSDSHWGMVLTRYRGKTTLTIRGPETVATPAYSPADVEFVGIQFKTGVFMPNIPVSLVTNRNDLNLPEASGNSFWLDSSAWQFPDYENADTFIEWLVRDELLACDPIVNAFFKRQPIDMSLRTIQRRLVKVTGLTSTVTQQIERARYATSLIKQGSSISDTISQAGYFDQSHLIRSLKRFVGLTPAQIIDTNRPERLSFLYNTDFVHQDKMLFINSQ